MEPATATDVCDGIFKSKNITVHGNATIIKQTGPKRDELSTSEALKWTDLGQDTVT